MEDRFEKLLNLCVEIEGLLALIAFRKSHTSDSVYALLKSKVADLNGAVAEIVPKESCMGDVEVLDSIEQQENDADNIAFEELSVSQIRNENTSEEDMETAKNVVRNDAVPVEFTLNDKFRFRNTLFGNNDSDMNEAMQIISVMNNMDEMTDYLYNDLCWEPENNDVKDFIAIVGSRFNRDESK